MDYHAYINSLEWAVRSHAAKARAGFKCQVCSSTENLNTHHNTYIRLGHELDTDLCCLCRQCHELFHGVKQEKKRRVSNRKTVKLPGAMTRTERKRLARHKRYAETRKRVQAAIAARKAASTECYGMPK